MTGAELLLAAGAGAGVAGAGVAGGLFAATTGASALGVIAVLLLTLESFGASAAGADGVLAASAEAGAELSALVAGAGVVLAAESFAGASFLAKAAVVKTSKVRVINILSFGFMCLIRSGVDGHVLRMQFFIPSPISSRGANSQKRPYEHGYAPLLHRNCPPLGQN